MIPTDPPVTGAANLGALELLRALFQLTRSYASDAMALLRAEWREKARALRTLLILAGSAMVMLLLAAMLLSLALVGWVAFLLNSWAWALLIVGAGFLIAGGLLLLPVVRGLRSGLFSFQQTRDRLRRDAEWVKHRFAA